MAECIEAMSAAFTRLAHGEVLLPLRQVVSIPGTPNLFALMPGQLAGAAVSAAALGAKVITVFPGNHATELDSHLGVVLLFDDADGRLIAIIDASSVTAIRTAAVSALATRLLANPGAGDIAILGTGVQAMTHLEAMREVRHLRRVRVWSRSAERRARFASRAGQRLAVEVEAMPDAESCVRGADIVCTVTSSREPVLRGDWLEPGAHVNAVGAALPGARELDTAAVLRAGVWVDRMESAMAEAGDILIPLAEGAIRAGHVRGELGGLLAGTVKGRESPREVTLFELTLFKSLGLAIEDLAAARVIHDRAVAAGRGQWIELGGSRKES